MKPRMDKQTCQEIFARFYRHNPHPKTELNYETVFELLIAVLLSAHTTDVSVNKGTAKLFPLANTPKAILALGEERLKDCIRNIGLYNNKAKHIIQTCQILIERHNSQVPNQREALEALPGVGRKTANVILNTAFGESTIAVDTHIFRVANRIGLTKGKTPQAVEKQLLQVIEPPYLKDAHHWLVLHGRYVCLARKPRCAQCFISDLCEFPDKLLSVPVKAGS